MKKIRYIGIFAMALLLASCFASASAGNEPVSNKFTVYFDVQNSTYSLPVSAEFELCDLEGKSLDRETVDIPADTYGFSVDFNVREYEMGTQFSFRMLSGLDGVIAGETVLAPGDAYIVETYSMPDGTPEEPHIVDYCYMTALPPQEEPVTIFLDYQPLQLNPPARKIGDTVMVPVAGVANAMGISDVSYSEEYNSVTLTCGKYQLIYNIGEVYTTTPSGDVNISAAPVFIRGAVFVPIDSMIEPLMSDIKYHPESDHLDVNVTKSGLPAKAALEAQSERDNLVNARGIASDTNYMIWVSKADYTLRVYTGSKGEWILLDKFLVGIGKTSTPTCVGQFRYYQYQSRWPYSGYYVGPVMRFNGGYAIHSVLMRYNGTEYDGRVGQNVSHGCVRVKADKMRWLADTIPLYTRIYVTND